MKLSEFEHIVWDWNGTLLNDTRLCLEIINGFLYKYLNKTLSLEEYRNVFDFPVRDYYQKVGFDFSVIPFEKLAVEFTRIYEKRKFECSLHRDIEKALNHCHNNGIKQSILSAYSQKPLSEIVSFFQISTMFNNITGLDNHLADGKLELAKIFFQKLDLPSGNILMIGDTLHDLEVSEILGVSCALIPKGHQSKERLKKGGGFVVENILDLV